MEYVKITDSLYLVEQEVQKNTKVVNVPKNVNYLFIIDRSGSMYHLLPQLAEDLKSRFRTLSVGDTVSFGWFSGEGNYRWVLKGFKITSKKDFDTLDEVVDKNKTSLDTTCFSEILTDTKQVVEELAALNNTYAMVLFTDGYPVVSNYNKEIESIKKAVKNISGKVSSSLLVGYGNYYNKELMSDMTERLGGSLVHQSDLSSFPFTLTQFMDKARDTEGRIQVELHAKPHADGMVFSLNGNQVMVYQVEDGSISYAPSKNAVDRIFVLTNKVPKCPEFNMSKNQPANMYPSEQPWVKAMYAAAYVLTQRTKTGQALDVLSTLGDVAIVDRVNNAFTNSEYGAAEASMLDAIGSREKQFLSGRKIGCVPSTDAFCLLDALDLLINDSEALFYPYHDEFHYNKVRAATKTKDGYPTFEPDKDVRVPLSDLVWNDTKLNLSIRAKIPGTIELKSGYKKVGLDKVFSTNIWRNYTLVKDGFLNVTKLPVTLSKPTYDRMLAEGVIDAQHNRHYKGRAYVLNLDRLPVMNRAIAAKYNSATELCKDTLRELALMANMKVLKFKRNEIEPSDERGLDLGLTSEQEEFLKENGVGKGGFNPPVEQLPTTDFYMAKELEIKIKGFSSLPKVDEVLQKAANNKALTPAQELVARANEWADSNYNPHSSKTSKLGRIDELIADTKTELNTVRSRIQRAKFAVIMGKGSWTEFSSRDNMKLTVDGKECTFSMREVRVDI